MSAKRNMNGNTSTVNNVVPAMLRVPEATESRLSRRVSVLNK